jgi:hypothetical protein
LSHEDKLTLITAALLHNTVSVGMSKEMVTNIVNQAEVIVTEIDSRKENNATG